MNLVKVYPRSRNFTIFTIFLKYLKLIVIFAIDLFIYKYIRNIARKFVNEI